MNNLCISNNTEDLTCVIYITGIGHEKDADIEHITTAVRKGNFKVVDEPTATPITFDLETTDLSMYSTKYYTRLL